MLVGVVRRGWAPRPPGVILFKDSIRKTSGSRTASQLDLAGTLGGQWGPTAHRPGPQSEAQHPRSSILSGRAAWQVLGGVKTSGSLMPSCRLKKRVEVVTLLFRV